MECFESVKNRGDEALFEDIKNSSEWETVEKVSKGWSSDTKYRIRTAKGQSLLLRVSDIEQYAAKEKEYEIIEKYSRLGFPMSSPIDFGVCSGGKNVYMLLTWVEGRDLEEVLPGLPEEAQYRLGREAGEILKRIHSIAVAAGDRPKETKKEKKLRQLSRYEASQVRIAGDEDAIRYVKENIDKIWKKEPVYMHGDYHPGNLIYTDDGAIGVIDFNRWEVGDPYEEFYKLESFGIEQSVPYCIGQIDAYFEDAVPEDFWVALAVYVAHASLYSIKWAERFGQEDVDGMVRRCRMAFEDYDGFRSCVPKWYTDGKHGCFLKNPLLTNGAFPC
ncbi:MAG: phosphotransferase [Roseburia sp.]|nr:phosphotransferase [Roseburia sp.]